MICFRGAGLVLIAGVVLVWIGCLVGFVALVLGLLGWDSGLTMACVVDFGFVAVFISLCLVFGCGCCCLG